MQSIPREKKQTSYNDTPAQETTANPADLLQLTNLFIIHKFEISRLIYRYENMRVVNYMYVYLHTIPTQ
ncbi:predicted protein [Botrytis cinerea T4]|uniref:Uncharacterized protein n=1 Tax=Botryotinia fuckeliana (strain T4) TaxID=999810 RepID=G2YDH4_BOTF4|nr:predicted protein [Botrytis cinerea T4]